MERITRRTFLEQFVTKSKQAASLYAVVSMPIKFFPDETLPPEQPPPSPLNEFLNSIEQEKILYESILSEYEDNPMEGIKKLSTGQILEDFNMYFPMYKAGELKYGIPWFLTWIIHEHETSASRSQTPEAGGHRGAMQLSPEHMLKEVILNAPVGFEFLDELPQRYTKREGWNTNDWEEILRGAAFIRSAAGWGTTEDDSGNFNIDPQKDEDKILDVIRYKYSAREHGEARVRNYYQLKELFGY